MLIKMQLLKAILLEYLKYATISLTFSKEFKIFLYFSVILNS